MAVLILVQSKNRRVGRESRNEVLVPSSFCSHTLRKKSVLVCNASGGASRIFLEKWSRFSSK